MKAYFVALTPDDRIRAEVAEAKLTIFDKFGPQKFLPDHPHSTIYVSLASDLSEVEERLAEIARTQSALDVRISDNWQEFPADKLAGGGTSLGLKFCDEDKLKITTLQRKVVDALNSLRQGQVHHRYQELGEFPDFLKESVQTYGYPFVSSESVPAILIPHISFCCFNPPENIPTFKELHPIENFAGPMKFQRLSLYRLYDDDKTELIKHFELQ